MPNKGKGQQRGVLGITFFPSLLIIKMKQEEIVEKLEWVKCCVDDPHHLVDEVDALIDRINEEGVDL